MLSRNIILSLCLTLTILVGCTNDPYETGDTKYSYLNAEMVNIHVKEGKVVSMTNDKDESLTFSEGLKYTSWAEKKDTTCRVMLYYNEVPGSPITIFSTTTVPVIEPIETLKAYTLKTDPVTLTSAWMSENGHYINLSLGLKGGNVENQKHYLDLTADSIGVDGNGVTHTYVTLRHDQNGIPEYYSSTCYLSIPVYDDVKGSKYTLRINTYDGTTEKEFTVK